MNEMETVQVLRDAMRRYAVNTLGSGGLGIFKGVESGVDVTMTLRSGNLVITQAPVVDVEAYAQEIKGLNETVKEYKYENAELKKEVARLKKTQKKPKVTRFEEPE